MPKDVIHTNLEEARGYADEVGGAVKAVDSDGDGVIDGYIVEPVDPGFGLFCGM